MHSYAQTNIQLFNQLHQDGYSNTDLSLVRDAYELAMDLFTGRYQPSGKPFIAHVVGTASILASLRLPATAVAAGLLHNVYQQGDFGDGVNGISESRRQKIRKSLGPEVETYAARFPDLYWEPRTIEIARHDPHKLDTTDRTVLLMLFADHLEHLLDEDVLYYDEREARFYIDHSKIAAEISEALGLSQLASELRESVRVAKVPELPVKPPEHRARNGSFFIAPKSCRKRFSVLLCQSLTQGMHRLHPQIRRVSKLLYVKSAKLVKYLSEPNGGI